MSKLMKDRHLSLCTVLLAFSASYYLKYKDMVNFDQPALPGIIGSSGNGVGNWIVCHGGI
jgi:hypothetical protein